jgi:hypothetical protein
VEWRSPNFDPFEAAEQVGIRETANIAKLRFEQLTSRHFDHWRQNSPGHYTGFVDRMEAITTEVMEEVSALWASRPGWFEAFCRGAVESYLEHRRADWAAKARDLEIARLEVVLNEGGEETVSGEGAEAAPGAQAADVTVPEPAGPARSTGYSVDPLQVLRAKAEQAIAAGEPEGEDGRKALTELWIKSQEASGIRGIKAVLCRTAGVHRSEFGKWERGKFKQGSAPGVNLMRVIKKDLGEFLNRK